MALDFENAVDKLQQTSLDISQAILALTKVYRKHLGFSAERINHGECENFADIICEMFPGASSYWGDQLMEDHEEDYYNDYAYHCFIEYEGRYYDSESPEGVDNWRDLQSFLRGSPYS